MQNNKKNLKYECKIKDSRKKLEKFINNGFDKIKLFIDSHDDYKEKWSNEADEAVFLYKFFVSWDNNFKEDNILKILENFIGGRDGIQTMYRELAMQDLIDQIKYEHKQLESK